jgi:pyruvate dehydrogenase E1 component beta subunit
MSRQLSYTAAIREAHHIAMERDPRVYTLGIAVSNMSEIFGTTGGLGSRFPDRVFDIPISESAVTGIAVGSALAGMRPVLVHMRLEFAMLSMDQLANQAAKWCYMSGGKSHVPLTVRMIVGRGWGQSSQHGQSLHAWFAHVPGLKVVMPSSPRDAKGLLLAAIEDPNPVIYIEHRWLHDLQGEVPEGHYVEPIGQPRRLLEGSDVTIVASSYATVEAWRAAQTLAAEHGIHAEVIDLRTLSPLDYSLLEESVTKTGRLVVCDQGTLTAGFAAEIVARLTERCFGALEAAPVRITLPDAPLPTTRALANYYYPTIEHIVQACRGVLGKPTRDPFLDVRPEDKLDVVDEKFVGPF